jgi:hypothetical protein
MRAEHLIPAWSSPRGRAPVAGVLLVLLVVCSADVLAGISPSLFARWKLNVAKSEFGGLTLTFTPATANSVRRSVNGGTFYVFTLDGRDVPIHSGYTSAWTQVNDHTWSVTTKLNGEPVSADRLELAADDQVLTVTSTGVQPDGTRFRDTLTYTRAAGRSGRVGAWKAKTAAPQTYSIEFVRGDANGVTVRLLAMDAVCEARFDGRDYPLIGAAMPLGATLSLTQTGPRAIVLIQKQGAQVISKSRLTLSKDGTTLVESVVGANGSTATATKVYERD